LAKVKERLAAEGNETATNCRQLKMKAADGKMRMTDVADAEQLLRLIQSIPSKKAEPFKLWLARVGGERMDETADPELGTQGGGDEFKKGFFELKWIDANSGSWRAILSSEP